MEVVEVVLHISWKKVCGDGWVIIFHTLLDYQASSFSKAGKLTGSNRHGGELIEEVNVYHPAMIVRQERASTCVLCSEALGEEPAPALPLATAGEQIALRTHTLEWLLIVVEGMFHRRIHKGVCYRPIGGW